MSEAGEKRITAELVRADVRNVDIKLVIDGKMHLLAWRRRALEDEVLVNGVRQQRSGGMWGRETVYGLVFGRNEYGEGGERLMLSIDPREDYSDWSGHPRLRGVRLESAEGLLLSFGSLDPVKYRRPASFGEWLKQSLGIQF
jgi:hypothetical protein